MLTSSIVIGLFRNSFTAY